MLSRCIGANELRSFRDSAAAGPDVDDGGSDGRDAAAVPLAM